MTYSTILVAILTVAAIQLTAKAARDGRDDLERQIMRLQFQYDPGRLATVPAARRLAPAERSFLRYRWLSDKLSEAVRNGGSAGIQRYIAILDTASAKHLACYAVYQAVLHHNHPALELLLANDWAADGAAGSDANLTAAAGQGDRLAVDQLLAHGANPNLQIDPRYATPLVAAASSGNMQIVTDLLRYGADPRVKTDRGETALSVAISKHHYDIAKLLRNYKPAVMHSEK